MKSPPATHSILVAENDPNDFVLLERALRDAGWKGPIMSFGNGAELIDFLRTTCLSHSSFDLVGETLLFLDLHIPQVDGCGIIAWIRRYSLSGVRIVVLSGSAESEDMKRASALGADRLLIKPPGEVALRAELENLTRRPS